MIGLYLALIGIVVGLVLDELVVHLAIEPEDDDEPSDIEDEAEPTGGGPSGCAETGSLALDASSEEAAAGVAYTGSAWRRRLLIVGATAALFAAAGARYQQPEHLAVVTAYICVLVVCAGTDLLSYRVPNVITYPATLGALLVGAVMPGTNFYETLAGGALAGGVLLAPALLTGGAGMGMGDVKLATFVGLAVGFVNVVPALILMALAGGGAAAFLLVTRLRGRREPIPYAPFISFGALAVLLLWGTVFVDLA